MAVQPCIESIPIKKSINDNLTGKILIIEHFSVIISIPYSRPLVTCVLSYSEPSLIDINGVTSELVNPGIGSGLDFSRSRS